MFNFCANKGLFLIKNMFCLKFHVMEMSCSDIRAMLEFYELAGVDETCGSSPLLFEVNEKKNPTEAKKAEFQRVASSHLAIAAKEAEKTADVLCDEVHTLDDLKKIIENFDGCSLKNTAANTVIGDGNPNSKILFVGEAPGADEDRIGRAFVGRSGQLLDKMLSAIGITRNECYICNILPWRPPGNRTPSDAEIAVCLPFLKKQIDIIEPDYIFALGVVAYNSLMNANETMSRLRGKVNEYETSSGKKVKVMATFHPAYLLRTPLQKAKSWADFLRLRKELDKNN